MAKEILLFDPEKGFYKLEVPEDLEPFPHLLNEAYVLGLSILHEEDDGTFALGIEQVGGAVTPWFEDLEKLEVLSPTRISGSNESQEIAPYFISWLNF